MKSTKRKLENEAATTALGHELSLFARKGMVVCLFGDLGAGKTTLARALIRGLAKDGKSLDVPSPTFALLQPYDDLRLCVHHYDLYRITNADEADELGLFDELDERLTIVEWPERLNGQLPVDRIEVHLEITGDRRSAKLSGFGIMEQTIDRLERVSSFLQQGDWGKSQRNFLQGDASSRRYERLTNADGKNAILMDMPATPDGPIIKDGKTYGQIAHIAEGIFPVAAINQTLCNQGFSAPVQLQQDLTNGLMIIDDFGDQVFGTLIDRGDDVSQPIQVATELLVEMAAMEWPHVAPIPMLTGTGKQKNHQIADFDLTAFKMETSLLLDWFWPMLKDDNLDPDARRSFFEAWTKAFQFVQTEHPVWILRDFHSPNLIWMPEQTGIKRVGLIDTQDCVMGHPAYDLVSMLQDARVDLPKGFEAKYFQYYCDLSQKQNRQFDPQAFGAAYAVYGAQRATKILGIFARLFKRDGKPGYLQHMPRVSAALEKNLAHPALSAIGEWYQAYLPVCDRDAGKNQ